MSFSTAGRCAVRFFAMVMIYGIKNCDTMKKAFAWLERAISL